MMLTITPSNDFVLLNGHVARRWNGRTETGAEIVLFSAGVAPVDPAHFPEIKEQLATTTPPEGQLMEYISGHVV